MAHLHAAFRTAAPGGWRVVSPAVQIFIVIVKDEPVAACSQLIMTVVAERRRLGALAGAEHHRAGARGGPFHRLERGALVRAVAERLALGAPAAAPPVGLALDYVDGDRLRA